MRGLNLKKEKKYRIVTKLTQKFVTKSQHFENTFYY